MPTAKTIQCACGCGNTLEEKDKYGRKRQFLPAHGGTFPDIKTKLLSKIEKNTESGCWEWQGARSSAGYGSFTYRGKRKTTHREAYVAFKGEVPEGFSVCHKCDNPACINPDHLFLGDHVRNMHDAMNKRRIPRKPVSHEDIISMRRDYGQGMAVCEIAAKYKRDRGYTSRVVNNKRRRGECRVV